MKTSATKTCEKSTLHNLYIFNQSQSLALVEDMTGIFKVYLMDAEKGLVGVERFSSTTYDKALDAFNIRKNCVKPDLKSNYIKRILGFTWEIKEKQRDRGSLRNINRKH